MLAIKFDYNPLIILRLKTTPGHTHSSLKKTWYLPLEAKNIQLLQDLGFDTSSIDGQIKEARAKAADEYQIIQGQVKGMFPFLYDYQVDCVVKGILNGDLLIADEMGLGKTIESMALGLYQLSKGKIERIIVCCDKDIKWQWRDKIKEFFNEDALEIQGNSYQRYLQYKTKPKIMLINYEQLVKRRGSDNDDLEYIEPLVKNQMIIYDEATALKNLKAKRTRRAQRLAPRYTIALTGTPVETKLDDAWVIGNIVHPDWMSESELKTKYYVWGEKNVGRYTFNVRIGYKNIDEFKNRLMEVGIRRLIKDVRGEVPPMIVYERFIPMTDIQKRTEDIIIANINRVLDGGGGVFAEFVHMQQVEDSTELIKLSEAITLEGIDRDNIPISCPKLDTLMHTLEEMSDEKILIFTRFRRMAEIIQRTINEVYIDECLIAHKDVDKEQVVKQFRDKNRFLVSTDCLQKGVDLPFVDAVINFDIHWNHAKLKQRVSRIRRATTKKQTKAINFITVGGADEYMYKKMKEGGDLFEKVMDFDVNEQLTRFIRGRR